MGFSVVTKQPKLLPLDAFLKLQICQKCFGRWGSLQRSPRPPSCDALLLRGGREGTEGGGRGKGERGGEEGGLPPASRGGS